MRESGGRWREREREWRESEREWRERERESGGRVRVEGERESEGREREWRKSEREWREVEREWKKEKSRLIPRPKCAPAEKGLMTYHCYHCCHCNTHIIPYLHTPSQLEDVELKPNGGDIDVTERNKREYVE